MKRLQEVDGQKLKTLGQQGFSLLVGLLFILAIAFIAAVVMGLMRIRWALLGFLVAVILGLLIASLPDIKRYMKISSM